MERRAYRDLTAHHEAALLTAALSNTPCAESAQTEIIRFFEQPIEWIAREVSPCPELLEDLKQEGRIALHLAIPRFDITAGTRLLTYTGKAMRRRMLRFIQIEGKHMECDSLDRGLMKSNDDKDAVLLGDTLPSRYGRGWIISQTAHHELCRALSRATAPLTQRQRTIVYLRFWENQTFTEISINLGISCTSVFRNLTDALSKIKRLMPQAFSCHSN